MNRPSPKLRTLAKVFLMVAVACSIAANAVMIRALDRALTAGERLGDASVDLSMANKELMEVDAKLKKAMGLLEAQIDLCLDENARRAELGALGDSYVVVTRTRRRVPDKSPDSF